MRSAPAANAAGTSGSVLPTRCAINSGRLFGASTQCTVTTVGTVRDGWAEWGQDAKNLNGIWRPSRTLRAAGAQNVVTRPCPLSCPLVFRVSQSDRTERPQPDVALRANQHST